MPHDFRLFLKRHRCGHFGYISSGRNRQIRPQERPSKCVESNDSGTKLLFGVDSAPNRWRRSLTVWALVAISVSNPLALMAQSAPARQILPDKSVVVLELISPQNLFESRLLQQLVKILQTSSAFRDSLGNPDLDLLKDSISHFESQLKHPLPDLLERTMGEGIVVSVDNQNPPVLSAIMTGRDPELLRRFPVSLMELGQKITEGRGQSFPKPVSMTQGEHQYEQLGPLFFTVKSNQWFVSTREATLIEMLNKSLGTVPLNTTGLTAKLPEKTQSALSLRVAADLQAIRTLPTFPAQLNWPGSDLGALIGMGGWLDLIHRANHVTAEVSLSNNKLSARLRFPGIQNDPAPGSQGFFATNGTGAAPLLQPDQTIASLSWFRDYWKMWEQRDVFPRKEQVSQLEKQIEDTETGVLGYSFRDILRLVGPRYRVVVTRPGKLPYRVSLPDRLPTIGFIAELRDEFEFREKVLPQLQRIAGIVTVSQKMITKTSLHQQAEITAYRFAEDAASISSSARIRYNFEPAFSVARGHLIITTSSELARELIDQIDIQKRQPGSSSDHTPTEMQMGNFLQLAGILDDLRGLAMRQAVLNDGFRISEAETELEVLKRLLTEMGTWNVQGGYNEQGFEYLIEAGNTSAN